MIRSLLVPVDGSSFSEHALPSALGIAQYTHARLHVALVHEPDVFYGAYPSYTEDLNRDVKDREQDYLAVLQERLGKTGKDLVQVHHLEGMVAETLEAEVAERGIDLVVMSTHGRGHVSRTLLGSVADRLMRRLAVPLLLVRPSEALPQLDQPTLFRRLLVPLDGSPLAETILEPATALGALGQAEFRLLRVVPAPFHFFGVHAKRTEQADQQAIAKGKEDAAAYLEQVAQRLRKQGLTVQAEVVVHAKPVAAILDEAHQSACDLIALATHGRGGLPRLLLGSVADKVVREAATPVLVFHPQRAT